MTDMEKFSELFVAAGLEFTVEDVRGDPDMDDIKDRLITSEGRTWVLPPRVKMPGKLFGQVICLPNCRTVLTAGEGNELVPVSDYPGGEARLYFDLEGKLAGTEGTRTYDYEDSRD